jgi:hypothetical protein
MALKEPRSPTPLLKAYYSQPGHRVCDVPK